MNAPSPLLRPLQVVAGVLAVAIAVLGALWLRQEPGPGPAPLAEDGPTGTASGATAVPANLGAAATDPAAAAPAGPASPAAPGAAASAILYGSVRTVDGSPPRQGVFWLYREGAHVGTSSPTSGAFVFAGLQPGTHRLRSRIEDELPIDRDVEVVAPVTRLDLELAARWLLTVHAVTPDGTPLLDAVRKLASSAWLRGLTVLAFAEALGGDLPPSNYAETEGGLGRFRGGVDRFPRGDKVLPKQTLGVLTLPPDRPVHVALVLRNVLLAQQLATPGQQELTFTLPAEAVLGKLARVRVRIVDRHGAPVAKARVSLNDAQSGGGGKETGEDGRVTLEHLVPGRLDLEIWAKDQSGPAVHLEVPGGADLDLGDVALAPSVSVELQLDNFGGKGSVRANLLDTIRPGWTAKDLYFSAENGKSLTYHLYPGRYALLASSPNGVATAIVDLRSGPAGPIRFDLQRGAELRLDYSFGPSRTRYEVTSSVGLLVRRREVSGSGFENVELPPGSYAVQITDQSGTTTSRSITLPATGLRLTLP